MIFPRARIRWSRLQRLFVSGVIVLLAINISTARQAGEPASPAASQEGPCDKAMSQAEMNMCSGEQYRKADVRLNTVYAKALALMQQSLSDARGRNDKQQEAYEQTAIEKLKAAERAWIQYRDLHCDAAGQQYEGGSMRPMVVSDCLKQTTDHRIEEIKQAYEDGDRKLE
jgi:uncharacterized protein YecT (DUF1311 family)